MSRALLVGYGLGWAGGIQAIVFGLLLRRWRPFDTPQALSRLRWFVGTATLIGGALSVVSLELVLKPAMPIGFKVLTGVAAVLAAPAICIWVSAFPPRRLVPAHLRFALRRALAATSPAIGESDGPGVVRVRSRAWPQRLWSVGVSFGTVVPSRQAIDLIAGQLRQDFRYTQPLLRHGPAAAEDASVVDLESLPWPPSRAFSPSTRFDATVSRTAFGSVIAGDIRLPWYPLLLSWVMVFGGVLLAVLSGLLGFLFVTMIGAGFYLAGRFITLPGAVKRLVWWLGPLATFSPPPAQ